MKLLLSTSTLILLVSILSLEGGLSSCTKDRTIYDTVTITDIDTITIKDTLLNESILTSHSWKFLESIGVKGGSVFYYVRGGTSNTESFDNAYYTFNPDHTGLIIDNAGGSHIITNWTLSTTDRTKLVYTAYNNSVVQSTYTWDNIHYKDGNLHYDIYFFDNLAAVNVHAQEILIPK